jgi:hypothetical protein
VTFICVLCTFTHNSDHAAHANFTNNMQLYTRQVPLAEQIFSLAMQSAKDHSHINNNNNNNNNLTIN